ncbi:myelin-associated glycoprotein-like [Anoplopoma fimbria]|uniref:myelin-associated glycoprotein-like n=1 Tax=Anoplopoma fimbria TaxID=229290 RepID=UPI0023ED2BAC|nr:myelin-associated glycoprotein-like [Anoplopoma fimbria]XP_054478278.1 myelin-associated glycoprotein-like [Anoplopoma fimbria]XP_054478279.1 myelin-associated glycoprotein-like [Anoplopoma fimbria]XP_054478280.1 myelin-associated glycoprotein-like [Anoplopoma fimbria]XP_054478281.1 myelin-associated glycoprotein-like [Anoplopoma fimbria]XP_054478282.1 myelin-associated glycoprotein-like [Anoplopoma fimbria]XP_054478283.1 myelin-associated glycoprotein-like [Anoplopoma fimbria]
MDSVKWPMFFVCLCFEVPQTEASSWTIKMPSSVKGLPGSCVVIPCSFNYPDHANKITEFTGMWAKATNQLIYHPDKSKMMQQYRNRTELLGDIRQKNCSLKIDPLQQSDQGPFHFRIEMAGYDKFSYKENTVTITMISEPNPIRFSVKEEMIEGQTVSASCSVSFFCITSPPVFSWSLPGEQHLQTQQLDNGQWRETSTLNFHPTSADHNKLLQCNTTYKGGQQYKANRVLRVKYAPENVNVKHKSDVKEGEDVLLKCFSDAQPPASSYQWQDETGAQLHQGNVYKLLNVSRHTAALFCTATNAVGQGKSNPVLLNVLYVPEIKTVSSCSSEAHMVKCVCIVESQPASMVQFVLSDGVLPNFKVEKHGSITIGTLQAEFGSSRVVYCLANNTLGKANLTLSLPVNRNMQNLCIGIASGTGGILVIILITVRVFKKCRGRSENAPTPHMSTEKADKDVALPQLAATKRKQISDDDVPCSGIYANDTEYGNIGTDWDEAIYANM